MRWPPRFNLPYRMGVGMMLINDKHHVLIAQRLKTRGNSWQMPQGGIDGNETPEQAAMRELEEEIGTNNVTILAKSKRQYSYDLPPALLGRFWNGRYRGQKQTWFLMKFDGEDSDIDINTPHPEFARWRWSELSGLSKLIVPFKRHVYQGVLEEFVPMIREME